jgi:hypothetical protein
MMTVREGQTIALEPTAEESMSALPCWRHLSAQKQSAVAML